MNKIKRIFKHFFEQKKNWFILILTFFVVAVSSISVNIQECKISEYTSVLNNFPDDMCIGKLSFNDFQSKKELLNERPNYFCYKNSSAFSNQEASFYIEDQEFIKIDFYGVDNNFLNNKILPIKTQSYFEFNLFSIKNRQRFTESEMLYGLNSIFATHNIVLGADSNNNIVLNENTYHIIGEIDFELDNSNQEIEMIFMTFKKFENNFLNSSTEVDFYSKTTEELRNLGIKNIISKNIVISDYNKKCQNQNVNLFVLFMLFLLSMISLMVVIFISIKNRINEIGIKLAVGASKADIVLEFLNDISLALIIGTILGLIAGVLVSCFIESIITLQTGISCLYLNLPLTFFLSSLFYFLSLLFSTIPLLSFVNTNIEMILKEER